MALNNRRRPDMRKLSFTLLVIAIAFLTIAAASRQRVVVPGKAQELKGVTRLYVSALSKETRDNIISEIKKQLPQVTITEKSEDAEVWLLFAAERRSFPKGDPVSGLGMRTSSGTSAEFEIVASGSALKPVTKERSRRLWEFKSTTETTMSFPEQALSTKFAKAFVKTYRKANP
jgi:hypothetical protein